MRKKSSSVEQMIEVLKQAEVGVPVAEVIRKAGISSRVTVQARYLKAAGGHLRPIRSYGPASGNYDGDR
jgi:hypothetical protein